MSFDTVKGERSLKRRLFGMPTLIELNTLEDNAILCRDLGLDFVEISMDMPEYQTDRLNAAELRRVADKYGIYYTIHLSGFLDPCVFDKRVALAHTETALETIKIAKQTDTPVLNMHLNRGDYFTLPDRKVALYAEYNADYLQKLADFRDKCTAAIGCADIVITLENCGDYRRCAFIQEGLDVLLESPKFALCFDIGHNATADYADEPAIMARGARLRHMHVHDAAQGKGNHLPLGDGSINLIKYLDLADRYDCRKVLEVKTVTGLVSSVEWLKAGAVQ
ncbi:hypothetical protein FACS1894191_1290 [Clostridia bacterium]|nr:hypothetical protein FACS1894191_1290 [Clostridia bacterium]